MAKAILSKIARENVRIAERFETWQEAVRGAVLPLVESGYVEPAYIQGIIDNANEYGPYFVICPDLALLHARPEQGALETQLALMIVREPVFFKPEGPGVRVLVTLSATDANSHLEVMRELAEMFSDAARIERLATAVTGEEAFREFASGAQRG